MLQCADCGVCIVCDGHSILVYWLCLSHSLMHTIWDVVLVRRSEFRRGVRGPSLGWPTGCLRHEGVRSILLYAWLCSDLFLEAWAFLLSQVIKKTLPKLVQNALLGDDKSGRFNHMLVPLGSGGIVGINEGIISQRER